MNLLKQYTRVYKRVHREIRQSFRLGEVRGGI